MTDYAIYLNTARHADGQTVLLTDGCWTAQANCYRQQDWRDYGMFLHVPRLFNSRAAALRHARQHCRSYTVRAYDGPSPGVLP